MLNATIHPIVPLDKLPKMLYISSMNNNTHNTYKIPDITKGTNSWFGDDDSGGEFRATHSIRRSGCLIKVMLNEGAAYTREEWDAEAIADYEVVDGEWLFQGEPFCGTVRKFKGDLK